MNSIFYDLETSGLNVVNQILTYTFWVVDDNWKPIKKLSNSIRIAKTQLPEASAIACNRIDVLEHQRTAQLTERQACKEIIDFIWSVIRENGERTKTNLIGFGNFGFDWTFLRNTLIRNGFNPYFYGKIVHKDIRSVVNKLFLSGVIEIQKDGDKLMSFENVYRNLVDKDYIQQHSSDQDVSDELDLAKFLSDTYKIDVRKYQAFEPTDSMNTVTKLDVDYETGEIKRTKFIRYLTEKNQSLWVDTSKPSNTKESLRWFNAGTSSFVIEDGSGETDKNLLESFSEYNLENYFDEKDVDIEQKITTIGFKLIDVLHAAFIEKDITQLTRLKSPQLNSLYNRNVLAHTNRKYSENKKFDKPFEEYIKYRYGEMLIQKFDPKEGKLIIFKHPTYDELFDEIVKMPQMKELASLSEYYKDSDIYKVFKNV